MGKVNKGYGRCIAAALVFSIAPLFVPFAYATATDYYTTSNGWWQYITSGASWQTKHDASTSPSVTTNGTVGRIVSFYDGGADSEIERVGLCFTNISVGTDVITGATLHMFGFSNYGGVTLNDRVVTFEPNNKAVLHDTDFSYGPHWGTGSLAGEQPMASQNIDSDNQYIFNGTGTGYLNAGGNCFGLRTVDDADNIHNTTGVEERTAWYLRDGALPPYITIYHAPLSSSSSSSSSETMSGSLIIGHYACDHYNGTGSTATCSDGSMSVEIPALRYFRNVSTDITMQAVSYVLYFLVGFLIFYFFLSSLWRTLTGRG